MSFESIGPSLKQGFESATETASNLLQDVRQFHSEHPVAAAAVDSAVLTGLLLLTPKGRAIGVQLLVDAKGAAHAAVRAGDDLAATALGKKPEFALETVGALRRPQVAGTGRTLEEIMNQPMLTDIGGRWAHRQRLRHSGHQGYRSYTRGTQSPAPKGGSGETSWFWPAVGASAATATAASLLSDYLSSDK